MKKSIVLFISLYACVNIYSQSGIQSFPLLFPANNNTNVNPDTHLKLSFSEKPALGNSGKIRVYDASNDSLVDLLDLSIPPGPTESVDHKGSPPPYLQIPYPYEYTYFTNADTKPGTPSGGALPNPDNYQLNIIGHFTDAFHFYPVIINDSVATIYLHNNLLEYNKTYYVLIDSGVISTTKSAFSGIKGKKDWVFSTKKAPKYLFSGVFVVNSDGSSDFSTVQGALDYIPDQNRGPVVIVIANGVYEEIVYFRNKSNITFIGEDREKTIICYANNEVFNPHPTNISTNEWPGTFPSRRAAFMADNSFNIKFVNLTIKTTAKGQAEGLLLMGAKYILHKVNIIGSGDALQTNGSVYLKHCTIDGDGDTYLGRGPVYFEHCQIKSKGTFSWIRNTNANHGAIFSDCSFEATGKTDTEIARALTNKGTSYPYCEAVLLNCKLSGISPVGWGTIGGDASNVHYWEYNSTNMSDGKSVDISKRHPSSKQLDAINDAEIIKNYSNPEYVLGGWKPEMAPIILRFPEEIETFPGDSVSIIAKVFAIPEPNYQWFKDGKLIKNANKPQLIIKKMSKNDCGTYSVEVKNSFGSVMSSDIELSIKTN